MTDTEFLKFVRSLIAEYIGEERFWTEEEIELYKKNAMTGVLSEFWHYLVELKKKKALISLVAGQAQLQTPEDFLMVVDLFRTEDNEPLQYIRYNEISWWNNFVSEGYFGWTLSDNKIILIPAPKQDKADYLTLWYMPDLKTLSDFPEVLHPLIAIDTVIFAKMKDENVGNALLNLREMYRQKAVRFLTMEQVQRFDR